MSQVSRQRIAAGALALAAALMVPGGANALENEDAKRICATELATTHDALNIRELRVRRPEGRRIVFGTADFGDGTTTEFRCRLYREAVFRVSFRVEDPAQSTGWDWVLERPRGTQVAPPTEDVAVTEPDAESPEEAKPAESAKRVVPSFQSVNSNQTGFRKPEAETPAPVTDTPAKPEGAAATASPAEPEEATPRARFVTAPTPVSTEDASGEGAATTTERPRFRKAP